MGREFFTEDGVRVYHPNREKPANKATRAVVILLLIVSIVLSLIVMIGGWNKLAGMRALMIAWMIIYVVITIQVARWSRGALAFIAALALLWAIFAAISGPGWLDRDKTGFTDPALDSSFLGMVTLLIVPVQLLLIAFALRGFQQAWNVEEEIHDTVEPPPAPPPARGAPGPQPAA